MTIDHLSEAMREAEEFLRRAKQVLGRAHPENTVINNGAHENGALRRQSLELSAALVRLRGAWRHDD
jgi:hypothetical protein